MKLESDHNRSTQELETSEPMIESKLVIDDINQPLELVMRWLEDAKALGMDEPDAMNIATICEKGKPRNRMVLMRHITQDEIGFFTNLSSHKSKEIIANPEVSATLWWPKMERQIRIQGVASPMAREVVQAYFDSRPRNSRIAAWASKQSQPLESMSILSDRFYKVSRRFAGSDIPLPEFWGGYTISVDRIEFWLGQPFRLHERVVFTKTGNGWDISRLFP